MIFPPRIKELKARLDELTATRIQIEADSVIEAKYMLDVNQIKEYVLDLRQLLETSEISERKAFLKSFVKTLEIHGSKVTVLQAASGWL